MLCDLDERVLKVAAAPVFGIAVEEDSGGLFC
jgi:hypothetical protein